MFAFSTLACPEWSADEVIRRAAAMGYAGIEWRGGPDGHVRMDWPGPRRGAIRRAMAYEGVEALAVTSYTDFIGGDAGVRSQSVDHLRRHLELAADLGARYVRAFVGIADDGSPMDTLIDRAVDGLREVVTTAKDLGVGIAIEPHVDFATTSSIAPILDRLDGSVVGVVWDIVNAWGAGEAPDVGIATIGDRILYVQVKDACWVGDAGDVWQLTPIGDGDVPLSSALTSLAARGPLPPLSVEWERAWHPELDPPDIALPRALAALRRLVDDATRTGP
jgi:sugar phosphate isomerase/epimerase